MQTMDIELIKRVFFALIGFRLVANLFIINNVSPKSWRTGFQQPGAPKA